MGLATCRRMVEEGARVAVVDLDADAAQAAAKELDGLAYQADVGDATRMDEVMREAARALGGLSILFNNKPLDLLRVNAVGLLSFFCKLPNTSCFVIQDAEFLEVGTGPRQPIRYLSQPAFWIMEHFKLLVRQVKNISNLVS